jgi:hypothetical protein
MSTAKPKRKNRQYTAQSMQEALDDVKEHGIKLWEAAKKHKVPYQTLKDKFDGKHTGKVGRKSILTAEDEELMVSWIQERAKMGFPLAKDELLESAVKIAERRGDRKFAEKGLSLIPCFLSCFKKLIPWFLSCF